MPDAKSLMIDFIKNAWVKPMEGKLSTNACRQYLSDDYKHHMPGAAEPMIGPAAYEEILLLFYKGMPDLEMSIEDIFGEGDRVCTQWRIRGTHTGELLGFAPSGRRVDVKGVGVSRTRDGMLCETVSSFDRRSLEEQLVAI